MLKISENKKCYLNKNQRKILLNLISNEIIRESFFLTGGTALSVFYLHHRKSNDIDLFTNKAIDISEIDFLLKTEWGKNYKKIKESKSFLSVMIDNTKVDFVIDMLSNRKKRERCMFENNCSLMIDNISNIVSNKLCTIVSRIEPKDFCDFYFLSKINPKSNIEYIYEDARLKDAIFDDPPTVAFQLEENIDFIKQHAEIFPELLIEFDEQDFYKFYKDVIQWIYNRIRI